MKKEWRKMKKEWRKMKKNEEKWRKNHEKSWKNHVSAKSLLIIANCCLILPIFTVEQHFSLICLKVHFTWTYFAKSGVPGVKLSVTGGTILAHNHRKKCTICKRYILYAKLLKKKTTIFPLDFYLSVFLKKLIFRYFEFVFLVVSFRLWVFCDFEINW